MAAKNSDISKAKKQELEDATTCCICTDIYTDPKLLPCVHTFCMKCLQETGLKSNKGPGDEMPCPICRQLFKIPTEGFHGLPNNSFIEKLIEVENIHDQSQLSKDICDACLEDNEEETSEHIPTADTFCVECKQKLCEECCKHHRKLKLTKNHNLVKIKELQKGSRSVMNSLVPCLCELHEQKALDVFCVKCNAVVCAICFIDDHKNHEGSHVSKFVNAFRQQIVHNTESMNECISQTQRKQAELMKAKEDMQQKVESLESDVLNRKDEMKQLLETQAHSILQGIAVLQRIKLKEFEVASCEVDAYLSAVDSFKTSCQKLMEQGSPSNICSSATNLSARAAELQQQCQSLVGQEIKFFKACLKISDVEQFLQSQDENLIGNIIEEHDPKPRDSNRGTVATIGALEANAERLTQDLNREKERNRLLKAEVEFLRQQLVKEQTSSEVFQADLDKLKRKLVTERMSSNKELEKTKTVLAEIRYKSDPVLVQRIGTRAAEKEKKEIRGLAILDEELFLVSGDSSEIEIYDLKKLCFSRHWNLCELMHPGAMASCSRSKCLYIFNEEPRQILRVDPNGRLITQWSTGTDSGSNLSVTAELNVILTVHNKNKLNEYSPDGQLIRVIDLSSEANIIFPLKAIQLANGHFVISHGLRSGELRRVCVIDSEVALKKSYHGEKPGSTAEKLGAPVDMLIDENGFVMVVDRENCRVLLLDSDLNFKRDILTKERHGLGFPCGICLDEENGRLFVVDIKLKSKNKLLKSAPISIFQF